MPCFSKMAQLIGLFFLAACILVLQWNAKRNRRERIYISYDSTKQKKRIIKKEQMQQHLLFVVLIFTNVEQLVKGYLQIRKHNQM